MEKGYSLYVDGTVSKPTDAKEIINWKLQDQHALGAIRNCVHRDLFFHIASCTKSQPAWDKLAALYGKVDEEKGFQRTIYFFWIQRTLAQFRITSPKLMSTRHYLKTVEIP